MRSCTAASATGEAAGTVLEEITSPWLRLALFGASRLPSETRPRSEAHSPHPFATSDVCHRMKTTPLHALAAVLVASLFAAIPITVHAAAYAGYTALDASQPVSFDGSTVKWNGRTF